MHDASDLVQRQIQRLEDLAEIGLEVARAVGERAKAAGPQEDLNALAMAYARVSRAVRQTVMLQSKVMQGLPEAEAPLDEAFERSEGHKLRVERIVERVIKAEHDDEDRIERLREDVSERLDDEDLYGEVLNRPIGELVALICRDLGLDPDWSRLAEEAWAIEETEGGDPRSPFHRTRPPPFTGEVAQRAGGGVPPPLSFSSALFADSA